METRTIDSELREALARANFGEHLKACAYRIVDEIHGQLVAETVLIIDRDEWDEVASDACRQARAEATKVLSETSVLVLLVCRTIKEHTAFSEREAGIWTAVDSNVACV